jgi:hypothetical protein
MLPGIVFEDSVRTGRPPAFRFLFAIAFAPIMLMIILKVSSGHLGRLRHIGNSVFVMIV